MAPWSVFLNYVSVKAGFPPLVSRTDKMSTAATSRLESIPVELIRSVCRQLDTRSLSAFSLASKQCHSVAVTYLFRVVRLNILDTTTLEREVQRWSTILVRSSSSSHVRILDIDDGVLNNQPSTRRVTRMSKQYRDNEMCRGADDLQTWSEKHPRQPDDLSPHRRMQADEAWFPLVRLICQLPALDQIVWACSDTFPRCLLIAMHQVRPKCRLNMKKFLLSEPDRLMTNSDVDQTDLAPFMDSFSLVLGGTVDQYHDCYHPAVSKLDAVMKTTQKLKHVHIWWKPIDDDDSVDDDGDAASTDTMSLSSRASEDSISPFNATVDTLQLRIDKGVSRKRVEYWDSRIDFANLKVLKLEGPIRPGALHWPDISAALRSLNTLVLDTWWFWSDLNDTTAMETYYNELVSFLQCLNPLSRLRITGGFDRDVFTTIATKHGASLQQLWLQNHGYSSTSTCIDSELIEILSQSCRNLRDLRIPIKRTRGNAKEVAIYISLSKIPTLRRLYLTLNATDPDMKFDTRRDSPSFDAFDNQYFHAEDHDAYRYTDVLNGQISNLIVNNTVDHTLSQSIFDLVSANGTPLESLQIETVREENLSVILNTLSDLRALLRYIPRSWLLTRDIRDTHRNEVYVQRIGRNSTCPCEFRLNAKDKKNKDLENVLRRLWRGNDVRFDDKNWWQDECRGFPLADITTTTAVVANAREKCTYHLVPACDPPAELLERIAWPPELFP